MVGDVVDSSWSYGKAPLARHHSTRVHVRHSFTNIIFQDLIDNNAVQQPVYVDGDSECHWCKEVILCW